MSLFPCVSFYMKHENVIRVITKEGCHKVNSFTLKQSCWFPFLSVTACQAPLFYRLFHKRVCGFTDLAILSSFVPDETCKGIMGALSHIFHWDYLPLSVRDSLFILLSAGVSGHCIVSLPERVQQVIRPMGDLKSLYSFTALADLPETLAGWVSSSTSESEKPQGSYSAYSLIHLMSFFRKLITSWWHLMKWTSEFLRSNCCWLI